MPKVFISYAHVTPDQDLAVQLSQVLEANGFSVFVDSKIRLGQDWAEQIDRQLRASEYFVVLLSAESVESDMVRREIALAYRLRKAKTLAILPIRLGFEGELPYEIGAYLDLIQYTVWHPGESFDPLCRTILQAMRDSTYVAIPAAPATKSDPDLHAVCFDPSELDRLKQALAVYLGPMARLVLDQATKKARNRRQLYEMLAAELPAGEDRKKFLATRPR